MSAILLVDAGNTRIKWGLHDGTRFVARGAVATNDAGALPQAWGPLPKPARTVASNVAGPAVRTAIEQACARLGTAITFIVSQAGQLGVKNAYAQPAQLGPDRWAALLAAHRAAPGNKLVVNAGTALTIDALTANGDFLGGLIVPGPALMRRSLDRGTAGLRLTEGAFQDFPRATPDAITSGAIQAAAGAVERMAAAMQRQGHAEVAALVSGGAAEEIAPRLSMAAAIHENLVLDGLALIAFHA
jgi:type III pantothenate kinase